MTDGLQVIFSTGSGGAMNRMLNSFFDFCVSDFTEYYFRVFGIRLNDKLLIVQVQNMIGSEKKSITETCRMLRLFPCMIGCIVFVGKMTE